MSRTRRRYVGTLQRPNQLPDPVEFYAQEEYNIRGWSDNLASISTAKIGGSNPPTWALFRDGIYAYSFATVADDEAWLTFHINHDYAVGSKVYPHVHWSPNTTSTGVVRWGIEYTAQKGHMQGAFPATTTIYLEDTVSSNDQYGHRIIEASDDQAFSTNLETDSLILVRVFRNSSHANDTFPDAVFGLMVDLHYQADKDVTPNKSPPFF